MKLYIVVKLFKDGAYCRVDAIFKTYEMAEKYSQRLEKLSGSYFYEIEEKDLLV